MIGDEREMAVVDLDAVRGEHRAYLADESGVGGLNAISGAHESHIIAVGAREIEHLLEQIQSLNNNVNMCFTMIRNKNTSVSGIMDQIVQLIVSYKIYTSKLTPSVLNE